MYEFWPPVFFVYIHLFLLNIMFEQAKMAFLNVCTIHKIISSSMVKMIAQTDIRKNKYGVFQ